MTERNEQSPSLEAQSACMIPTSQLDQSSSTSNDCHQLHKHGKPVNVLKFSENDQIIIEYETLEKMLLHEKVKHRKIVAISIIGAYRKGKSFFLDYCLRYLYAHFKSINYPNNPILEPNGWMGEENEPLLGFSWRSGPKRDTTGLIVWNDVFLYDDLKTGNEIAIIIMDTQGLFDSETSPMGNSRIFALGTLISSIQVLNLSQIVHEDQLQYLQFATEFAKFAAKGNKKISSKPFQHLTFLIRDWVYYEDHNSGIEGGMEYLESFLKMKENQNEELRLVRQFIKDSFEKLKCYLLPHPGDRVAGNRKRKQLAEYNGNWGEMDEEFVDEFKLLVEDLLNSDEIVLKKINEIEINAEEYLQYLTQYFTIFQSNDVPKVQAIYEAVVEKNMIILVNSCFERYKEVIVRNEKLLTNINQIPIFHRTAENDALLLYKKSPKMGNKNHELEFKELLLDSIQKFYHEWTNQSESSIKYIEEQKEITRQALKEKFEVEKRKKRQETEDLKKIQEQMEIENKEKKQYEEQIHAQEITKERLRSENILNKILNNIKLEKERSEIASNNQKQLMEKIIIDNKQKSEKEIKLIQKNSEIEKRKLEEKTKEVKQEKWKEINEARREVIENEAAALMARKERDDANLRAIELQIQSKIWEEKYTAVASSPAWNYSKNDWELPDRAVLAGYDSDENPIYVARAICGENEFPGKFIPNKKMCSISHDGLETQKKEFYVLTGNCYKWEESLDGSVPKNTETTGQNEKNETIYIARTKHEGHLIPGYVIGNEKLISIPFEGKEIKKSKYKFLVEIIND